jgi:hypothetical protein
MTYHIKKKKKFQSIIIKKKMKTNDFFAIISIDNQIPLQNDLLYYWYK